MARSTILHSSFPHRSIKVQQTSFLLTIVLCTCACVLRIQAISWDLGKDGGQLLPYFHSKCEQDSDCGGKSRNLTCNVLEKQCVCTEHPDPGYSYEYLSDTDVCTPVSKCETGEDEDCIAPYSKEPPLTVAVRWHFYVVPVVGTLLVVLSFGACWVFRSRLNIFGSNAKSFRTLKTPLLPVQMLFANRLPQIGRAEFVIDPSQILGRGKGGIVYGGTFGSKRVAVKTLNPDRQRVDMYLDSMHQEIEIFKSLPEHPNIVRLLAYSYAKVRTGERIPDCHILMELCSLGSLRDFFLTKSYYYCGSGSDISGQTQNPTLGYSYNDTDLLTFAHQIATGAEYLAQQRIVHGDLACRNVLLDLVGGGWRVKITDFGLARKLDESPIYTKTTNEPVPWKWSAPEVIARNEFSLQSDVWSYGVLLWEIFSKGEEPYRGVSWSIAFSDELYNGRLRLLKPHLATMRLYRLMKKCWQSEPSTRISLSEIRNELERLRIPKIAMNEPKVGADGYLVQLKMQLQPKKYVNANVV